jgi:predicted DNA-binding protein (MmcQ/YjbR family)
MKAGGLKRSRNSAARLNRLVRLCESLPDATAAPLGRRSEHRSFLVRKKIFGYYCFDHHGDGRIALWCKAGPGEQSRLVEDDPGRYFIPPYLGARGWIAVRLDLGSVDWAAVAYLVRNAYRMTATRAQVARLE